MLHFYFPMKSRKSSPGPTAPGTAAPIPTEKIAERARRIWEEQGRPEGRDLEHWLEAERQLRADSRPTGARSGGDGSLTDADIESDKSVDGLVQRPRSR
jgi:hypothetical protein